MPRRKRIFTKKNLRAMGMDRHSARAVNKATARLEVWPESHWPRFLLIKGDGLQSYTAWWHMINVSENQQNIDKRRWENGRLGRIGVSGQTSRLPIPRRVPTNRYDQCGHSCGSVSPNLPQLCEPDRTTEISPKTEIEFGKFKVTQCHLLAALDTLPQAVGHKSRNSLILIRNGLSTRFGAPPATPVRLPAFSAGGSPSLRSSNRSNCLSISRSHSAILS